MLDEFLAWWLAQWHDILPATWRAARADRTPVLIVEPDRFEAPSRFAVRLRQGAEERRLGDLPAADGGASQGGGRTALASLLGGAPRPSTLVLLLPPGMMLARDATLPLAAERDLGRVLHYEMDRLTPFPPEDLLYSHVVTRRDRAASRLGLRVSLVPRTGVATALASLAEAGLAADALEGVDAAGTPGRITLGGHGGRGGRERRAVRAAWALVALLLVVALVVPFLRQGFEIGAAERRIAALHDQVEEANAIRARIEAATAGADVLQAARRDIGDPLATLASLTRALPDDTFLTDLSLTGRKLTINGQSASAAKLIGVLSADPDLRDPSFVAPVTRLETTHTDLFSIKADLASPADVQPPADAH